MCSAFTLEEGLGFPHVLVVGSKIHGSDFRKGREKIDRLPASPPGGVNLYSISLFY